MHYLIIIHLFKSRFLVNLGVATAEVFMRGRAMVATEEEAGSSGIDDGGGDRLKWHRRRRRRPVE
jgi:hypothetical protein